MARTTEDKVESVVTVDKGHDLAPHITAANILVTKVLATAGYDDDLMELIERYLAAHMYRIFNPMTTSETLGSLSESKSVSLGQQLKQTLPGQQVLVYDVGGHFALLQGQSERGTQKRTMRMLWLGTKD